MASLEKYYTNLDRELLELAAYHKKIIQQRQAEGKEQAEDAGLLKILDDMPRMVNNHAQGLCDYTTEQNKITEDLLQSRQLAECPKCKKEQPVKIKSETKHPNYNWKCDKVECQKCHKQFINHMPNNWNDRMKLFDTFIMEMLEVRTSGKSIAEQMPESFGMNNELQAVLKFKQTHIDAERELKNLQLKMEASDKALEQYRDYLLMAKINGTNWNNQSLPS